MKATEIFTPGVFPKHTYVERSSEKLETRLKEALDTPGMLISISGPSKSGKTVLVEKIVGKEYLIPISGAGINSGEEIWNRVLNWIEAPSEITTSSSTELSGGVETTGTTAAGILVAKAEVSGSVSGEVSHEKSKQIVRKRTGLDQVIREIGGSEFTIFIDDFHYILPDVQTEVAKQFKEAIRNNIRIIYASVPYHADDIIRANTDFRGRVIPIDLSYWKKEELIEISNKGFEFLKIMADPEIKSSFAQEAAGSPQLMQAICLNACLEWAIKESRTEIFRIRNDETKYEEIFNRTSLMADYNALTRNLIDGPKTRGIERKQYQTKKGITGDVYKILLSALSMPPSKLTFRYAEIIERLKQICVDDFPSGSSIIGSFQQMVHIANETNNKNVIEWISADDVLDIRDPYFLFFIRWSNLL